MRPAKAYIPKSVNRDVFPALILELSLILLNKKPVAICIRAANAARMKNNPMRYALQALKYVAKVENLTCIKNLIINCMEL